MRGVVGPNPSQWRARWLFDLRGTFLREDGKKLTQGEFADRLVRDGIDLGSTEGAKNPAETLRIRYGRWEKGTEEIPAGLLEAIASKYERDLPSAPSAPKSEGERLIEALRDQTTAINNLIETLTPRLTALEAEVARLKESEGAGSQEMGRRLGELERQVRLLLPAETSSGGSGSGAAASKAAP